MNTVTTLLSRLRQRAFTASLGLGLVLGSCNVLDYTQQDAILEDVVYTDASRIALAVTGVYDAAQSGYYNGNNANSGVRGYPFGAASTDLGDARGEDITDIANFFGLVYSNTIGNSSPNVVYMWANLFTLVNKANVTIAGIKQAQANNVISASQETAYEGELRFLRALAYMELVINWSKPYTDGNGANLGVPYRDTPVNTTAGITSAGNVDRGTVANVYEKMLVDLDFAENNIPTTATGKTRATKGAAIALKQRLNLYKGDWAGVIREGNKLINGTATFTSPIGGYTLAATQRAAFTGSATTGESIFSIENSSTDNASTNGGIGSVFGNTATVANGGAGGRALLAISPTLYNAPFFTCNDLRRTQMMQVDVSRYVSRKYLDGATNTDYNPIMRYAEVLLNQAEALSRTGQEAQALALLNAVRNRSVAAADQYTATTAPAGDALTQAILNERRIEFVAEGLRWGDISRLATDTKFAPYPGGGIPAKYWGQTAGNIALTRYSCGTGAPAGVKPGVDAIPYKGDPTSYLFLWPIPVAETQLNPKLTQNPGYGS
ncbi:MAG: RagB/SusD family nutrient uptake outer membrane protein [Hymenobacter sp.]|nr:MAG: RagB/SusD family nutrient uptake outer membrane protein [Hymenobacter sp.]